MFLLGLSSLLATASAAVPLRLTLLHSNDVHSHLDDESRRLAGAEFGWESDVKIKFGGYPRTIAAYSALAAAAEAGNRTVLKVHAGDEVTGSSYYSLFRGEADALMMAHLCFDAFEVGNHEFDDGDAALASFIERLESHGGLCGRTAVLGANVIPGDGSPLKGKLRKSVTISRDGQEIGIVGINVRGKTVMSSSPSAGTTLADEATTAQSEIDVLLAKGVNKIVLLTHVGFDTDVATLAKLRGVDVIVGGDSHSLLGDENTTRVKGFDTAGAYPTVASNGDGKMVCVAQAWEYSKAIGQLHVDFDAMGDVVKCAGTPIFAYDDANMVHRDSDKALTTAELKRVNDWLATLGGQWQPAAKDIAAQTALKSYEDRVTTLRTEKIADVPADLCYDRFPGQGRSSICAANHSAQLGGAACQVVAHAFLSVAKAADIAIQNGGGCRTDIASGNFTHDDAYTMLPFSNTLVTMTLTGAQIKSVLEEALSYGLSPEGSTGAYPYCAGLRFHVDASNASGSRFGELMVNARLAGGWAALDAAKEYVVVTNSYIAGGRDGYATFTKGKAMVNTFIEYAQGLVKFARAEGTIVQPPRAEFSTQSYLPPAAAATTTAASQTSTLGMGMAAGALSPTPLSLALFLTMVAWL